MKERFRIRAIPPRTTLDAFREQEGGRGRIGLGDFSGSSVGIGRLLPRESGQSSSEQSSGGFNVKDHVFRKPVQEKPAKSLVSWEIEKITWQVEIIEDLNEAGEIGLIMQFSGINLASAPVFERSRRDYGPDNAVFYTLAEYKNRPAFLIFSTFGDIFESQVVPKTKDVNPFFRKEIYYPKLLTDYVPASMRPSYNNGLFIMNYKARG